MIVITGISRGIGKYLWEKFSSESYPVVGLYRKHCKELENVNGAYCIDISNNVDVEKWVYNTKSDLTSIVLINSAGINYNEVAHKANFDEWKKVIEVNLFGTFSIIHAVLPIMRQEGWGRIINFSSVVAQMGAIGTTAYASSKAALWGLTKSLAKENGGKGITINTLNLGYFDIGMINEVPQKVKEGIIENIPSKRLGNPFEIYQVIQLLIKNEYINGSMIDVNAGLY